jgi:hypothetical protein
LINIDIGVPGLVDESESTSLSDMNDAKVWNMVDEIARCAMAAGTRAFCMRAENLPDGR